MSDENILAAWRKFHAPSRRESEMQSKFNTRVAACLRLQLKEQAIERAEWKRLRWQEELIVEANQLREEQTEYDTDRSRHHKRSKRKHRSPQQSEKDVPPKGGSMKW
jgi:hypothetical protein